MFAAYIVVTLLASAVNGLAAVANFIDHDFPRTQADNLGVPQSWKVPLGSLLAAGSLGLLGGFAVPLLGVLAAGGLVLYFLGALVAHLRVRDAFLAPWSVFFALAVAALVVNATHYGA